MHHLWCNEARRAQTSVQARTFRNALTSFVQQVVYVREGVAVWPTKSQRIMGRLSLIKQHQVMFLAWLPYSQGSLNRDGTFYSSATAEKSAVQSAKGAQPKLDMSPLTLLSHNVYKLSVLGVPITCTYSTS